MKRILFNMVSCSLWASPNSSIYDMMLRSEDRSAVRRASALQPVYSLELADPVREPPIKPARPLPKDAPVPETRDVPVREPMDVPPPKPEKPIKPAMPQPEPKPRHAP